MFVDAKRLPECVAEDAAKQTDMQMNILQPAD